MRLSKVNAGCVIKKITLLLVLFLFLSGALFAQTEFPKGNFWSLDAGVGMSDILVDGMSFQLIIEPKLWLSPALMVGSKAGINYSTDNILTLEGQAFLRWNFLRFQTGGLGNDKITNIFVQGGIGLLAAYRGDLNPFDDVTRTRGSALADAALGITIPLTQRLHIEPFIRGGYPHIWGAGITAGYKFPLPQKTSTTEYIEIIRTMPPNEIVKIIKITSIEFILFGPDIGRYNIGIDRDAQQLNELVLNQISNILKENPDYRLRIEGHVNPYTTTHYEIDDLMALSTMRANAVAEQLRQKGVSDEQMVIVGFGGTRTATNEWDVRNRNRRVELMIIQFDN